MTKRLEEKLCMWSQTLLKLSFLKPNIAVFLHRNTSGSCQVHNCALYSKTTHSAVILLTHLFQYGLLVCLFISQVLPTNSGFILPFITWEMFSLNAWTEVFSLPAVGRSIRQYSVQSNSGESPPIGGVFFTPTVWWDCWGKPQNRLRTVGNLALPHCWHWSTQPEVRDPQQNRCCN